MTRALLATLLAVLLLASAAQAGTYEVHACTELGDGANNSWVLVNDDPSSLGASDDCTAAGDPRQLGVFDRIPGPPDTPAGSAAHWRFLAPTGATIVAVNGNFDVVRRLTNTYTPFLRTAEGTRLLSCPGPSASCTATHTVASGPWAVSTSSLELGASCDAATICTTGFALHSIELQASAISVTLSESTPPTLTAPTGSLWADGYRPRAGTVTFGASDPTSGVREARLYIDGNLAAAAAQSCDDTRPRPCSDQSAMTLSPAPLADGSHHLQAAVVDAAGNETMGPARSVLVDGGAPAPPEDFTVSASAASLAVGWRNPTRQVAPLTDALVRVCAPTRACATHVVAAADQRATIAVTEPGTYTVAVWLRDAAGNEAPQDAAVASALYAPAGSTMPPSVDAPPTASPPAPPESQRPRQLPDPRLSITQARRRGRLLTVSGRTARAALGRIDVTYRPGGQARNRTVRRTARIHAGRWRTTIRLGPTNARASTGTIIARFPGSRVFRAASTSKALGR